MHGALIDSELLARVYLAMTGGQSSLLLDEEESTEDAGGPSGPTVIGEDSPDAGATDVKRRVPTVVIEPTADELAAHEAMLEKIRKAGACVWDID